MSDEYWKREQLSVAQFNDILSFLSAQHHRIEASIQSQYNHVWLSVTRSSLKFFSWILCFFICSTLMICKRFIVWQRVISQGLKKFRRFLKKNMKEVIYEWFISKDLLLTTKVEQSCWQSWDEYKVEKSSYKYLNRKIAIIKRLSRFHSSSLNQLQKRIKKCDDDYFRIKICTKALILLWNFSFSFYRTPRFFNADIFLFISLISFFSFRLYFFTSLSLLLYQIHISFFKLYFFTSLCSRVSRLWWIF